MAVGVRLFIKARLQKTFALEDVSLLIGVVFLISAEAILFVFKKDVYLVEAILLHASQVTPPSDIVQRTAANQKWVTTALELLWMAIISVKFSFLLFFRKFIGSCRRLMVYWWIAVGFNLLVFGYGIASYVAPCSGGHGTKSSVCGQGDSMRLIINYAIAQVVLDVVGDIMILAIPVYLWWNVKIHWDQKIPTLISLCLALLLAIFKMLRPAAMGTPKDVTDLTWSVYWQYIVAEVGVILAAAAAYRAVAIPESADDTGSQGLAPAALWRRPRRSSEKRALLWSLRTPSTWRSKSESSSATASTTRLDANDRNSMPEPKIPQPKPAHARKARPMILTHGFDFGFDRLVHGCPVPNTPRRTGIRTFIAGPGSRSRPASHVKADASRGSGTFAEASASRQSGHWHWPTDGVIRVEEGIESYSIHVRGSQDLTREAAEHEEVPELPDNCVSRPGAESRAESAGGGSRHDEEPNDCVSEQGSDSRAESPGQGSAPGEEPDGEQPDKDSDPGDRNEDHKQEDAGQGDDRIVEEV